jgi:hypothetical protein
MKKPRKQKSYHLREGMVFEKIYYGKTLRLLIVRNHGELQFKVDDQIFPTLTAAARHVCGDATRQISGPLFWGIQVMDSRP